MFFIKKPSFLVTIVLLSFGLAACDQKPKETETDIALTLYIQFLKDLGDKEEAKSLKSIPDIFVDDIVKITDGHSVAKGYKALEKHFTELRNMYGAWYIVIKEQSLSHDHKSATLKYEIATDKTGLFEIVAMLKLADDNKIKEVNELYYRTEVELED